MTTTLNQRLIDGQQAASNGRDPERYDVVVIGGGQAGLASGYYLSRLGLRYVILDASDRIGDSWRTRWDTLRVFSPARYDGLPGMPFPAPPYSFPSKDDVAGYLEAYAHRMNLPVRSGVRVSRVTSSGSNDGYLIIAGDQSFEASQVIIATGAYHHPRVPDFARDLDPDIVQFHSSDYRNAAQLQEGSVLIAGASNSGAEIAHDIVHAHKVWLVGRNTGRVPFSSGGITTRVVDRVFWFAANHILTLDTPLGRKARPFMRDRGAPIERIKPADLVAAGVERAYARVIGTEAGLPKLDDGRVIDVANVIWCTGYRQDFSWIDLAVTGEDGWPRQERGIVPDAPGLYFIGLPFMHAFASPLIGGVGRDASYITDHIATRARTQQQLAATGAV